jgi:hypothetical protein
MAWQEGGKIKYAQLHKWNSPFIISEAQTIDSIGCSDPVLAPSDYYSSWSTVSYLKTDRDNQSIYYAYLDTRQWDGPYLLSDAGNNTFLLFAEGACNASGAFGDVLAWDCELDGAHTIKVYNFWDDTLNVDFSQGSPYYPAVANYMIPVNRYYEGFMAFVNADEGNRDIFLNDDGWELPETLDGYGNLSDSPYEETHPAFYNGRCAPMYYCDLILLWESWRNDHWQIYCSLNNLMCAGGMDESVGAPELDLDISPNPARDRLNVIYTIGESSVISLDLFTAEGRQFSLIDQEVQPKGSHTYILNMNQVLTKNRSGLILIKLQVGKT